MTTLDELLERYRHATTKSALTAAAAQLVTAIQADWARRVADAPDGPASERAACRGWRPACCRAMR